MILCPQLHLKKQCLVSLVIFFTVKSNVGPDKFSTVKFEFCKYFFWGIKSYLKGMDEPNKKDKSEC